jgi:RNase P/RNase MRP subunit p29
MSERSRTAQGATGRRGRHPALRLRALAALLVVWAAAPGAAPADEILLRSGERIEGTIIDATRNTVVVRRAIGGMRQMPIRDIEEMRVDLVQGGRISGRILSWAEGVHRLRAGNEVVSVRGGRVVSRAPYEEEQTQLPPVRAPQRQAEPAVEAAAPPRASEAERPAAEPPAVRKPAAEVEKPAAEAAEAAPPPVESPAAAAPPPEDTESAAAGPPAEPPEEERPPAEPSVIESPRPDTPPEESAANQSLAAVEPRNGTEAVAIRTSVDLDEAGAPGVVFRIELSRPAERTVVLIYGTVDGTAKAGEDYEPRQGVLTLAPGTRSADVRVPLIEPRDTERDSRFELFLTADPKVATIAEQRITATIPGDS